MASAALKWQTAVSRSLSVDPGAGGPSKGVNMWAAAIAQGAADAVFASEAQVTHRPGAPGVVCGTLNLLGEGFNPFEFIATGDKAFMGKQHPTQNLILRRTLYPALATPSDAICTHAHCLPLFLAESIRFTGNRARGRVEPIQHRAQPR